MGFVTHVMVCCMLERTNTEKTNRNIPVVYISSDTIIDWTKFFSVLIKIIKIEWICFVTFIYL